MTLNRRNLLGLLAATPVLSLVPAGKALRVGDRVRVITRNMVPQDLKEDMEAIYGNNITGEIIKPEDWQISRMKDYPGIEGFAIRCDTGVGVAREMFMERKYLELLG